jgi:hypothetical protein
MRRTLAFAFVFATAPAWATESSLLVTAELSSVWQGYSVTVDGQQLQGGASNQPKRMDDLYPGRHDVAVEIWTPPFKHHIACQGMVDVPRHAELRVKCAGGRLAAYGSTKLAEPAQARISVERINVRYDTRSEDGTPSVGFRVHRIRVAGLRDHRLEFGFNAKQGGRWMQPVRDEVVTVGYDDSTWDKRTYYLYLSALDEHGDLYRPFVGSFYVRDVDTNQELYSKQVTFRVPIASGRSDDRW